MATWQIPWIARSSEFTFTCCAWRITNNQRLSMVWIDLLIACGLLYSPLLSRTCYYSVRICFSRLPGLLDLAELKPLLPTACWWSSNYWSLISLGIVRQNWLQWIDFFWVFCSLFLLHRHIQRAAVVIKPSTLLKFHQLLKQRKYRLLYSSRRNGKPCPKGPSKELVVAIIELKRRNPSFGCPRIAQPINLVFGIRIDKDVARRVLAAHFPSDSGGGGSSWLTFLGHTKDSLLECGSVLIWIHSSQEPLGARCHGSVHSAHNRLWSTCRRGRRCFAMLHVQQHHIG